MLTAALRRRRAGPYQLQAAIAVEHARAASAAATDWDEIARLYEALYAVSPSPVVALNRAVAVGEAGDVEGALAIVDGLDGLEDYHLLHATRGDLLVRLGDDAAARAAFERAFDLTRNEGERAFLRRAAAGARRPPGGTRRARTDAASTRADAAAGRTGSDRHAVAAVRTGTICHALALGLPRGNPDRSQRHDLPRVACPAITWQFVPVARHELPRVRPPSTARAFVVASGTQVPSRVLRRPPRGRSWPSDEARPRAAALDRRPTSARPTAAQTAVPSDGCHNADPGRRGTARRPTGRLP